MNILSRLLFWFEKRQGYLKLNRYRTNNTRFYSVLMYHGVENNRRNLNYRPYDLPEQAIKNEIDFFLEQGYRICSSVDVHDEKSQPDCSLMISFDDGHRNIAKTVSHLSRHYQIRPIIAICPGVIESGQPFWFEEIYARLSLTRHQDIHPAVSEDSDTQSAYRQIMDYYLANNELKASELLADIRQKTNDVGEQQVRAHPAVHKNLDWDELCSLVDQNSCIIAVHTLHHDSVLHMDKDEFERDVSECKRLIQKNLNVDSMHFVYPFGQYGHDWESQVLSDNALEFSYIVDERISTKLSDNYQIPRITGRDISRQTGYYRFLWHQRHAQLITLK